MDASAPRNNILKRIKQALAKPVPVPFPDQDMHTPVFLPRQEELDLTFAENFTRLEGHFSYCGNTAELTEQLRTLISTRKWERVCVLENQWKELLSAAGFADKLTEDVASCDVSVTGCEYLVARTGSMVMSSAQQSGRTTSVYAPVHICIAFSRQLVYDISEALQGVQESYGTSFPSLVTLATGPSRTADIEKTLVVGVHGPREVFCFLVDNV
ncbi:MAG TPA: LUD domain-containing protein [Sediminibacterium sp.]|nr:LUD domain-containing protein [Sediminibacterium sp.]